MGAVAGPRDAGMRAKETRIREFLTKYKPDLAKIATAFNREFEGQILSYHTKNKIDADIVLDTLADGLGGYIR